MNQLTLTPPPRANLDLIDANGRPVWFVKNFKGSSFAPEVLRQFAARDWGCAKRVLKHPGCPDDLREHYAQSPRWYERLVAMLAAPARATHWRRALADIKSTVRAAAVNAASYESYITEEQIDRILMNDEAIHGYFDSEALERASAQADRVASASFDALALRVVTGEVSSKDVGLALGLPGRTVSRLILDESRAGRSVRWIEYISLFCETYNVADVGESPVHQANRLNTLISFVAKSEESKAAMHLLWQAGALKKMGRILRRLSTSRMQVILAGTGDLDFHGASDLGRFFKPDPSWRTVGGEKQEALMLRELREAPLARITSLRAIHDYLAMIYTRENRLWIEGRPAQDRRNGLLPVISDRREPLPQAFLQTHGGDLESLQGRMFSLADESQVRAVVPSSSLEIVDLGQTLQNCVGARHYIEAAAEGRTLLVALEEVATGIKIGLIEIKNGRLVQAVGSRNKKLMGEFLTIAQTIRDDHSGVGNSTMTTIHLRN